MKEQKTPEQFYEKSRLAGETYNITSNDHPNYHEPFYQCIFRLMEKYSDQQNAELREKLRIETQKAKAFGNALDIATKDELSLKERAKELEDLLAIWVKQNNYLRRHSISDFDDIHNQTKNALKK